MSYLNAVLMRGRSTEPGTGGHRKKHITLATLGVTNEMKQLLAEQWPAAAMNDGGVMVFSCSCCREWMLVARGGGVAGC